MHDRSDLQRLFWREIHPDEDRNEVEDEGQPPLSRSTCIAEAGTAVLAGFVSRLISALLIVSSALQSPQSSSDPSSASSFKRRWTLSR